MSGMRDDHAAAGAVHVTPRGFAGPNLLAMILFEKFGQHQPLNRSVRRLRVRLARSAAAASLRIAGAAQARQHRAQPVRLNSAACIASRAAFASGLLVILRDFSRCVVAVADGASVQRALAAGGSIWCDHDN